MATGLKGFPFPSIDYRQDRYHNGWEKESTLNTHSNPDITPNIRTNVCSAYMPKRRLRTTFTSGHASAHIKAIVFEFYIVTSDLSGMEFLMHLAF